MKLIVSLFAVVFLAGCTNGNVACIINKNIIDTMRVSYCEGTDEKTWLKCVAKGKDMSFYSKDTLCDKVIYEPTILSPEGSDFCTELGLFCSK